MSKENNKKILAISASPAKGRNSDTMLDNFILGVRDENENIHIDKVYLNDIYFEYYSHNNSEGPVEGEEEFAELMSKIKEYKGIVIATPTYNFSVPAKLKNLIDRMKPIALDSENENIVGQPTGKLKNKDVCFLISGGTPKIVQSFIFFLFPGFWLKAVFAYYGAHYTKSFYSGDVETFKNKKILNKCRKMGKRFAKKFK